MRMRRAGGIVSLIVAVGWGALAAAAGDSRAHTRDLFAEYLGVSRRAVDAKLAAAWQHFFAGDEGTQRLFYPVGEDAAYMLDTGNNDVRSEGMSYGMMLAVQLDRREEFDRLWTWAKQHMYHANGPQRGYFAWQCTRAGQVVDPGSASDGEEWFTMALLFAANRWGDANRAASVPEGRAGTPLPAAARPESTPSQAAGSIDYAADAQALLRAMRNDQRGDGITAIFSPTEKQVVFAPNMVGSTLTDPSYHLPAFTSLWAQWDADADGRAFWQDVAATSRRFYRRAANPATGLMPEYAHFDGSPFTADTLGPGKGDFRFDAWRTLANVALDHAWWAADPWQVEQSNRVLGFLGRWGEDCPNQFTLSGEPLAHNERPSLGLTAMAAVAGLAADQRLAQAWVERLWQADLPEGQWRYYNGLLYFLALLEVGGRFQVWGPPQK